MELKTQNLLFIVSLIFLVSSCEKDPVEVEFMKFTNDLVMFSVKNNTENDIYAAEFEITYYSSDNEMIKKDTVSFKKTKDINDGQMPFVRTNDDTFFSYKMPEGTASATARSIGYIFEKN